MNNTAKRANEKLLFISDAHEQFYKEKLNIVRTKDCYHKALIYCLGINADTRANVDSIYDFENGLVKPKCLHAGWQTSGSSKVTRIAMNLYCNGTPSVIKESNYENQISANLSISESSHLFLGAIICILGIEDKYDKSNIP